MKTPARIYRPTFGQRHPRKGDHATFVQVECMHGSWGLF